MTPQLFDSGVPHTESEVLATLYQLAAARLREIVLNPPGGTQASLDFARARAAAQVSQIDKLVKDLGQQSAGWIGKNVPRAFNTGIKLANQQAVEAGVRVPGNALSGSFEQINSPAVRIFAIDIARDLSKGTDAMAGRAKAILRETAQRGLSNRDVKTILAQGVIEGQPLEATRRLRDELIKVHGETVPIIDKNGREMNIESGRYAEMVARTMTRQAAIVAKHDQLQRLDMDLVMIIGRLSKNFCTAFLNQVFSLSGKSSKFPAYSRLPGNGPPFHPFCSKSTRPFIDELATKRETDRADGLEDAQQLLGMDTSKAQRAYQDLQIFDQQRQRLGGGSKAA